MKNITTRQCELTDNINIIIDLIVETDKYIYPPMFRMDPSEKYLFFEHCLKDEKSMFFYKNIFLATVDQEIAGIIVYFKGEVALRSGQDYSEYSCASDIRYCDKNYFELLCNEYKEKSDIVYISNICVLPSYRNQGIGKKLLESFLELQNSTVELDALCDNSVAIQLYKNCGFSVLYDEPAFSFDPSIIIKSCRMRKTAVR